MRAVSGGSVAGARKSGGQISQGEGTADRFVHAPVRHINGDRIFFRDLARMAWPDKTDAWLAHVSGVDPRTCRRWLAGDNEPPADVLGAVLCEIMKRYHRRG